MAGESWLRWPSLPAWLGSEATWFLVLNVIVAAIAVLSSRTRSSASPRSGAGVITRRASSALLQRLRSFSIFSYPSAACFNDTPTLLQHQHAGAQATEEEPVTQQRMAAIPSPRALVLTSQAAPPAAAEEEEEEEEEEPSAMSMEEAYALVVASRRPPEPEEEDDEARRSDVDAKEKEKLRQQRLNSIFNYTQMLKQRALAAGRRQPDARRDQL